MLNLVRLLYSDANANTVHARFDKNFLILITRNRQGVKENFWGAGGLNLRDVVSFRRLRSEVRDREGGGQRRSNTLEIWSQRLGLRRLAQVYAATRQSGIP